MEGTFYDAPNDYRNYLAHHGIKGQHWGVRHGPPYPLDTKTHNAVKKQKDHRQGDLITYLAFKAVKAGVDAVADKQKKKQMAKIIEERSNGESKIDKKTGLRLKSSESTEEEDLKVCNPLYSSLNVGRSANHNCGYCSFAYELRRRGFDTIAKLSKQGIQGIHEMEKIFPTSKPILCDPYKRYSIIDGKIVNNPNAILSSRLAAKYDPFHTKKISETFDHLASQNNSRGILMINWRGNGGHACNYFVKDGSLYICDAQTGKVLKTNKKYLKNAAAIIAYRTDNIPNKDINFDEIMRFVQ